MDRLSLDEIGASGEGGTASFRTLTAEELDAVSGGDLIKAVKRTAHWAKTLIMWEQACRDGSWLHCNILDEIERDRAQ